MEKATKNAYLLLKDGTLLSGISVGAEGEAIGEIVFSTSMVGYQEALTDPSNHGQILVQTFPLLGNYGVNSEDFESDASHVKGYVMREMCDMPSNFRSETTLDEYMKKESIVGIADIDTRFLTKVIREKGTMPCLITTNEIENKAELLKKLEAFELKGAVEAVSPKEEKLYKAENKKALLALLDLGVKRSTVRKLNSIGFDVLVLPYNTKASRIKEIAPDCLFISDGPGNPKESEELISNIKEILELDIRTMATGLGHQLVALANGFEIKKLVYGHRGANQPVVEKETGKTYITSQNHSYYVESESVKAEIAEISYINANDKTCEGIEYKNHPVRSYQFSPDCNKSIMGTSYIFDKLLSL